MVAQIAEPIHLERVDWTAREMPADLTPAERSAYVRGYARGCHTYVKKNGGPAVVHDGPAPAAGTPERRALGIALAAPALRLVPSEPAEEIAEEASGERAANRTRKLARRELAEAMRARGEDPRDAAAWAAAKLAAGVK